jgi:acetyltransferase-like isoleucine patch superfamily enzyme
MSRLLKWGIHNFGNVLRWVQVAYLRACGVRIGKDCMISLRAKIDTRRGLVVIGDRCTITYGAVILSHDRSAMHIHPGASGEGIVRLGDSVYVGVNAVILPGVTIGNNSVIGAGAVVTRDIPPNVVAVGNPARVVKEIEHLSCATSGVASEAPAAADLQNEGK